MYTKKLSIWKNRLKYSYFYWNDVDCFLYSDLCFVFFFFINFLHLIISIVLIKNHYWHIFLRYFYNYYCFDSLIKSTRKRFFLLVHNTLLMDNILSTTELVPNFARKYFYFCLRQRMRNVEKGFLGFIL